MSKHKNIAIVGATGAVGNELLNLLEERNFPIKNLRLLASAKSKGKKIEFKGEKIAIEELTHQSFKNIDIVFSSASGSLSKEFIPSAVKEGAVTIDNTSYFRLKENVPLVIPEVNKEDIKKHQGIIANPNCSTIIMLVALAPLHKKFKIKRIFCATYQAASGAGFQAMQELQEETQAVLDKKKFTNTVINQPYAFNLFCHNSPMDDNYYAQEEMKMINETHKILNNSNIKVNAFCVRVPIMRAHSEAINVEFENPINPEEAKEILANSVGITMYGDKEKNLWATPLLVSKKDNIYVGRIRKDLSQEKTLDFWVVGDQIRKGAALNSIQIAEELLNE